MKRVLHALLLGVAAAAAASGVNLGCGSTKNTVVSPGGDALDFLRPAPFDTLVIEVIPVNGRRPDEEATALLLRRAREHCNKPGGITLVVDPDVSTIASGAFTYT